MSNLVSQELLGMASHNPSNGTAETGGTDSARRAGQSHRDTADANGHREAERDVDQRKHPIEGTNGGHYDEARPVHHSLSVLQQAASLIDQRTEPASASCSTLASSSSSACSTTSLPPSTTTNGNGTAKPLKKKQSGKSKVAAVVVVAPRPKAPQHLESAFTIGPKIRRPSPRDVLCGRGRGFFNHPGNRRMLEIVERNKARYRSAGKTKKTLIVKHITDEIQEGGARFLKKEHEYWYEVGPLDAHKKVCHCLRETKTAIVTNNNGAGAGNRNGSFNIQNNGNVGAGIAANNAASRIAQIKKAARAIEPRRSHFKRALTRSPKTSKSPHESITGSENGRKKPVGPMPSEVRSSGSTVSPVERGVGVHHRHEEKRTGNPVLPVARNRRRSESYSSDEDSGDGHAQVVPVHQPSANLSEERASMSPRADLLRLAAAANQADSRGENRTEDTSHETSGRNRIAPVLNDSRIKTGTGNVEEDEGCSGENGAEAPAVSAGFNEKFGIVVGEPRPIDILFGIDPSFFTHHGNVELRKLIRNSVGHKASSTEGKFIISKSIIAQVKAKGSRFLTRHSTGPRGRWYQMTDMEVETLIFRYVCDEESAMLKMLNELSASMPQNGSNPAMSRSVLSRVPPDHNLVGVQDNVIPGTGPEQQNKRKNPNHEVTEHHLNGNHQPEEASRPQTTPGVGDHGLAPMGGTSYPSGLSGLAKRMRVDESEGINLSRGQTHREVPRVPEESAFPAAMARPPAQVNIWGNSPSDLPPGGWAGHLRNSLPSLNRNQTIENRGPALDDGNSRVALKQPITPGPYDVVRGKQPANVTYPGNNRLQQICQKFARRYLLAKPQDREIIVQQIMVEVSENGGVFQTRNEDGTYTIVEKATAFATVAATMDKLCVALSAVPAPNGAYVQGDAQMQMYDSRNDGSYQAGWLGHHAVRLNQPLRHSQQFLRSPPGLVNGAVSYVTAAAAAGRWVGPEPRVNDVVCGRGKGHFSHPGNRRMLRIIVAHQDRYKVATKSEKADIAKEVIAQVKSNGARFLRRREDLRLWEEVDEKEVFKKVCHGIRDSLASVAKKQNEASAAASQKQLPAKAGEPDMDTVVTDPDEEGELEDCGENDEEGGKEDANKEEGENAEISLATTTMTTTTFFARPDLNDDRVEANDGSVEKESSRESTKKELTSVAATTDDGGAANVSTNTGHDARVATDDYSNPQQQDDLKTSNHNHTTESVGSVKQVPAADNKPDEKAVESKTPEPVMEEDATTKVSPSDKPAQPQEQQQRASTGTIAALFGQTATTLPAIQAASAGTVATAQGEKQQSKSSSRTDSTNSGSGSGDVNTGTVPCAAGAASAAEHNAMVARVQQLVADSPGMSLEQAVDRIKGEGNECVIS